MNAVVATCNAVGKTVQMHIMSKTSLYYMHVYTKQKKCSDMDSGTQCIQQLYTDVIPQATFFWITTVMTGSRKFTAYFLASHTGA